MGDGVRDNWIKKEEFSSYISQCGHYVVGPVGMGCWVWYKDCANIAPDWGFKPGDTRAYVSAELAMKAAEEAGPFPAPSKDWKVQWESGNLDFVEPKDLWGALFLEECGCDWVDTRDGKGWRQIGHVIRDMREKEDWQNFTGSP